MGAPEVEDAAGGGEGVVLKIQAAMWQGCCPDFRTHPDFVDKPLLLKGRFGGSRWRGGRYRVYSVKRRWSLEELTVQRYDDVDMSGETSSTSMNINNCLIAQLLFLQ